MGDRQLLIRRRQQNPIDHMDDPIRAPNRTQNLRGPDRDLSPFEMNHDILPIHHVQFLTVPQIFHLQHTHEHMILQNILKRD